ncbi:hypothetical protein CC1G_06850 [Coprinopsis cinerea okayama7|uniref:Uncharacterized protein n=1 Tax=Coprinopsis cinerea (strain Okayama-7 / 130 / ATCC MYA-4618 / FGSC 9003) TaxID=240176 RepID=A8N6X8_COPC7|nr:hypothetical protein CC1G_06850 [Coprinopsis cinerea okayama7\|eukprot:XP_001830584.2 hypothetical protein CC1G_06850 [Coprinopsis cinerea okayama7\
MTMTQMEIWAKRASRFGITLTPLTRPTPPKPPVESPPYVNEPFVPLAPFRRPCPKLQELREQAARERNIWTKMDILRRVLDGQTSRMLAEPRNEEAWELYEKDCLAVEALESVAMQQMMEGASATPFVTGQVNEPEFFELDESIQYWAALVAAAQTAELLGTQEPAGGSYLQSTSPPIGFDSSLHGASNNPDSTVWSDIPVDWQSLAHF